MDVAALLLAAGESTRMGSPKPLLEWHGATLIEWQIGELFAAGCGEVIAVLGHRAEEVRPFAERAGARVVVNAGYRAGRAGSIRTGALALPAAEAVVLLNVDQPRSRTITRRLLDEHFLQNNLISVPLHAGRHGHPAVLAGSLLPELQAVEEASEGLRAVMRRHQAERVDVPFDDPTVLLDLNLPGDYEAARAGQ